MKRMKSILAMVVVIAMVFVLSTSTFATGNPVSVSILWEGIEIYAADVYTTDVDLYKSQLYPNQTGAYHLYDLPTIVPTGYPVTYPTTYTAADALIAGWIKANIDMEVYADATDAIGDYSYVWVSSIDPSTALYFDSYAGLPSYDGDYYLESTRTVNGITYYTYVWAGYTWNLYVDDCFAGTYSSEYAMSDIDSVIFDYNWVVTAPFETTTYFPSALPGPVPITPY